MKLSRRLESPDPFVLYPVRVFGFEVGQEGEAVVLLPRYGDSWLGRLYTRFLGKPFIRLPLDRRGTRFWQLCNGTRDFRAICDQLVEEFGQEVEPIEERGLTMLRTLLHQGCIKLFKQPLEVPLEELQAQEGGERGGPVGSIL